MRKKEKLTNLAKQIKPEFHNEVVNGKTEMTLSGVVGGGYLGDISAKDVREVLDGSSGDIIIYLNSPGGDVFEGIEIYNLLKSYSGKVTIKVTALAASAASLILMAADEIIMCTGSQLMIHEASTICWGNKNDMKKTLNALETIDESIISIYCEKTGQTSKTIQAFVEAETWFTAKEAVENKFATSYQSEESDDEKENNSENETEKTESNRLDNFKNLFYKQEA